MFAGTDRLPLIVHYDAVGPMYRNADRQRPRVGINRNTALVRCKMARSSELSHSIGTSDRPPEVCGESVDHRRCDRRAARIDMYEAIEVIALRFALIHERDKGGDRTDDEGGLVFEEGVERSRRLKAVGQDKSSARCEGCDQLDLEARDMEKGRYSEKARGAAELEMIAAN